MKKPKVDKINLPYASSVASFFGDQGSTQGNSFLGRLFKGGGRTTVSQVQPGAKALPRIGPSTGVMNGGLFSGGAK